MRIFGLIEVTTIYGERGLVASTDFANPSLDVLALYGRDGIRLADTLGYQHAADLQVATEVRRACVVTPAPNGSNTDQAAKS